MGMTGQLLHIRRAPNHAAQQVGHGAALAVAAAVTQDPGRIRFRAAQRYGMAVSLTTEGTGKGHHRAGQYGGDQYVQGAVFPYLQPGPGFDDTGGLLAGDGDFVADQLADGLKELGQIFAAGREACLFDDMQKLPLTLLNGGRGYGRAKDAEFRVAVDIVGFFALGFLPDGGRVFHAYSSYPMMSTVWAGA